MKDNLKDYYTKINIVCKDKNYWIDQDKSYIFQANDKKDALNKIIEDLNDDYIKVSKNAIKNKKKMYVDKADGSCKEIGFVLDGFTDIFNDEKNKYVKNGLELWIEIREVV